MSDLSEPPLVNIREDPRKGVYCEATDVVIASYDEILRCMRKGTGRRHVAETLMNEKSSRSHTIFRQEDANPNKHVDWYEDVEMR